MIRKFLLNDYNFKDKFSHIFNGFYENLFINQIFIKRLIFIYFLMVLLPLIFFIIYKILAKWQVNTINFQFKKSISISEPQKGAGLIIDPIPEPQKGAGLIIDTVPEPLIPIAIIDTIPELLIPIAIIDPIPEPQKGAGLIIDTVPEPQKTILYYESISEGLSVPGSDDDVLNENEYKYYKYLEEEIRKLEKKIEEKKELIKKIKFFMEKYIHPKSFSELNKRYPPGYYFELHARLQQEKKILRQLYDKLNKLEEEKLYYEKKLREKHIIPWYL